MVEPVDAHNSLSHEQAICDATWTQGTLDATASTWVFEADPRLIRHSLTGPDAPQIALVLSTR